MPTLTSLRMISWNVSGNHTITHLIERAKVVYLALYNQSIQRFDFIKRQIQVQMVQIHNFIPIIIRKHRLFLSIYGF